MGVLQYDKLNFAPVESAPLSGIKFIKIDPGQEYTLWSILNTYANRAMNEMFLDLKPGPSFGALIPTIILRQYPWTTSETVSDETGLKTTLFTSLPKFRLPEEYIVAENTGKSNKVRYNYIQIFGFGTVNIGDPLQHDLQTALGNFAIDKKSISRHGLSVMKIDSDYDLNSKELLNSQKIAVNQKFKEAGVGSSVRAGGQEVRTLDTSLTGQLLTDHISTSINLNESTASINDTKISLVADWTKIYADWHLNSHLWVNGTWQTVGIEEPISLGMNMEVLRGDGSTELHHVESYSHSFVVGDGGFKTFRTQIATVRGRRGEDRDQLLGQPLHIGKSTDETTDNIGLSNTQKEDQPIQIDEGEFDPTQQGGGGFA
jgi:hypothetical protein